MGSGKGKLLNEVDKIQHRRVLGKVMYLAHDRPDVQYHTRALARTATQATEEHWNQLVRIVKYLQNYPNMVYNFGPGNINEVRCYVDANWGGEHEHRSVSGGVLYVGTSLVSTW